MNGNEMLRIVDAIHRDKGIDKELVFVAIEQAMLQAARKHYGEEEELTVAIDRVNGETSMHHDSQPVDPDHIGDILGRISAQTAKQVMIQKFREVERDQMFDDFAEQKGQIVTGTVGRTDGGMTTVSLGKTEGILPRSEQIPGESYRVGDRVRAVVIDVRKQGNRVRIVLSRTHPDFVRRLFELEIPEIAERIIEIRSIAREAGYRSKVAVSCVDQKVDAVGACVGVRGARIKNIVDELAGERIDIVKWNDALQVLVPNGLQPAETEEVILCPRLGKVIVLVRDDQLSLAIGKKGQNVRLASRLVGWDIDIMTRDALNEQLDQAITAFSTIPNAPDQLAENLVEEGFLTFDDLSVIEPDDLAELAGLTVEEVQPIIDFAEAESERLENEARLPRPVPHAPVEEPEAVATQTDESAAEEPATADAAAEPAAPADEPDAADVAESVADSAAVTTNGEPAADTEAETAKKLDETT